MLRSPRNCKHADFKGTVVPRSIEGVSAGKIVALNSELRCPGVGEVSVYNDHVIASIREESHYADIARISESMFSVCVGCKFYDMPKQTEHVGN